MSACNCCQPAPGDVRLLKTRTSALKFGPLLEPPAGIGAGAVSYAEIIALLDTTTTDYLLLGGDAFNDKLRYANPDYGNGDRVFRQLAARSVCRWAFYSATCYVWIAWDIVSQLSYHGTDLDPPPEVESSHSMTWNGTTTPCFPTGIDLTTPSSWNLGDEFTVNPIQTTTPEGPPEAFAWETSTTINVENIRWSFVPGYTPDISDPDNPQPNGFPDPTWGLAAP